MQGQMVVSAVAVPDNIKGGHEPPYLQGDDL